MAICSVSRACQLMAINMQNDPLVPPTTPSPPPHPPREFQKLDCPNPLGLDRQIQAHSPLPSQSATGCPAVGASLSVTCNIASTSPSHWNPVVWLATTTW